MSYPPDPTEKRGKIIIANKLIEAVCEASGVRADRCRRVIIDAEVGEVIKLYYDMLGDDQLLELVPPLATAPGIRRYMLNEKGEHVEVMSAA